MESPGEDADGEEARVRLAAVVPLRADAQREGHGSPWGKLVVPQHCLQEKGQEQKTQARHGLMQEKRGRVLPSPGSSHLLT